jgi:hypothetical protein
VYARVYERSVQYTCMFMFTIECMQECMRGVYSIPACSRSR